MGDTIDENVFLKIEKVACECSSVATNAIVDISELYQGRTKTSTAISVARQMALLFMHDHYGISYRRIARRSNMKVESAIRCVRKAREWRFTDPIYGLVYQLMEDKL